MFAKFTKALNDAGKDIQRSVDSAVKSLSEAEQRERERVKVSDVQYYQDVLRVPVGLPLSGVEFAELLRQYSAAVPVEKERLIKSVGLHQGRAFVCQQVVQLIKADQIPINSVGAAVYCHPRCVDLANWNQVEAAFDVPASRAWCQERIRHATTSAASAQAAVMQLGMPVVTQPVVVQQGMPVNMSVTPPPMGAAPPGMTLGMNVTPPPMGATPGMTVAPTTTTTVTVAAPMPAMVAPPMAPINTSPQQLSLEMRVANLEATVAALLSELRLTRLAVGIPDPMLVASANAAAAQQAAAMNAAAAQQAAAANAAAANAAAAQQAAAAAAVTAGALAATGAIVTAGAMGAMGAMDASNQVVVADPFVAQANSFALGAPGASFSSTTGDIPGGMFTSSSMTAPIAGGSITESSSAFNQDFGNSHSHGSSHSVSSTQTGQSNFSFGGMNMTGTTTVKSSSSHSESHSSSVSFGGGF